MRKNMGSKIFFLLGVSMAIFVLLISSAVGGRDLAESSSTTEVEKKAKEAATVPNGIRGDQYPPGYGSPTIPGYGTPTIPGYGTPTIPGYGTPVIPGYGTPPPPEGGYPMVPTGGGCPYGCCGAAYYGTGCTCCSYAGQAAVQAKNQPKPHN